MNHYENFKSYEFLPRSNETRFDKGGIRFKIILKKENLYPYISIITVVCNGEKYLEETIKSVINQTYKNYEYIVIDGGSKDKTLDIIKNIQIKLIIGLVKLTKVFMMHLIKACN